MVNMHLIVIQCDMFLCFMHKNIFMYREGLGVRIPHMTEPDFPNKILVNRKRSLPHDKNIDRRPYRKVVLHKNDTEICSNNIIGKERAISDRQ